MKKVSVRLSNACIVTKRNKDLSIFYTIRKIISPSFLRRRMVGGATPSTWNSESAGRFWTDAGF